MGTQLLPGYTCIAHLRRGEDTDVYDAWSSDRECRCIVKRVAPGAPRAARARLLTEGTHLNTLTHPHLVRAYEVHTRPAAVILETLTGATLSHVIEFEGRSPLAELGVLAVQLSSVLGYLHRHGLIHLDVKPSNIVCQDGQVKLIDLGIAAPPGRSRGYGSPGYMAPEQRRGGQVGPATDVWGLGRTLFEAATGEPARREAAQPAPPSVRTLRRLPRTLADIIDACHAVDPAQRPSLAEVVAAATPLAASGDPSPTP